MRALTIGLLLPLLSSAPAVAGKLTPEERVEILRGLTAEYATLKVLLPRSKKPLPFESSGTWDKRKWEESQREFGPAGRPGDLVQITKIEIEDDKILLEINGGLKSGRKWYERIEVGMGTRTTPVGQGGTPTAGSNLALHFPKDKPPQSAAEIKKLLLPLMDFEKRSATEQFINTLPPEIQQAVKEQRIVEGMDRDTVMLVAGRPRHKTRETKDGIEFEDWIYGEPPGKITFVTFRGNKVVKVRDAYAGLGGTVAEPQRPPI